MCKNKSHQKKPFLLSPLISNMSQIDVLPFPIPFLWMENETGFNKFQYSQISSYPITNFLSCSEWTILSEWRSNDQLWPIYLIHSHEILRWMVFIGFFKYKWDQQRTNESKIYLKYRSKNEQYCVMLFLIILKIFHEI